MPDPTASSLPPAAEFGTVVRDPLPEQIANRLVALISERQLRPGDRLPPERELAVTMGVSRASLREALRALSLIGVTEMRQGAGNYVASLDSATLMRPLGLVLALSDAGFNELFEARKLVEPKLAALAAERATEAEIARLVECVEASAAGIGDDEAFMRADLELHGIIAAASRNEILERVVGSLAGLGVASRMATTHLEGMQARVVRDHRRIAEAVAARDAAAASAAMLAHLEDVERRRLAAGKPRTRRRGAIGTERGGTRIRP
jgi:GntR family transcriptional regulator, transcriptional repressor for pyruvate dehydrogenase complex